MPLAIARISVCRVDSAKRITAVVRSSDDLTSITGRTPARAFAAFALAVSAMVTDFAVIILSKALVTKASVSISTFVSVWVYSFSISSVIALK